MVTTIDHEEFKGKMERREQVVLVEICRRSRTRRLTYVAGPKTG